MYCNCWTGSGESVLTMAMSAFDAAVTRFEHDAVLFAAVQLSVVPLAVEAFTWTTGENVAVAPDASEAIVQVIVPLAPTAGVTHAQPAGGVSDRNPTPAGIGIDTVTFGDAEGPLFVAIAV